MSDELPAASSGQPAAWTLAPKRRNFLARLWHGELSLGLTYWVFGVLIGGFLRGVLFLAAGEQDTVPAALSFVAPALAYGIFAAVAIWRSAGRYRAAKGSSALARLARFFAVMGVLSSIASVPRVLPGLEPDQDLDAAISSENKDAPKMFGNGLRFDKASRAGRVFFYDFTLTSQGADQISATAKQQVFPGLLKTACTDSAARRLLFALDRTVYRFHDKDGRPAFEVDLTKADCPAS